MFSFELRPVKALSLVIFFLGLLPWSLAQPVVVNAQTGLAHGSINEAVSAAANGDTLYIDEADWPESLDINKDLTLIGLGDGFRLTPQPSVKADLVVIRIKFQKTVTIKNMEVFFLNEEHDYLTGQGSGASQKGVRAVIINNGWLKLVDVDMEWNRTLKGVIVNKGFAELYTDNVMIISNRAMDWENPAGGVKNHGLFEAYNTKIWFNHGRFGGLYNSGGDAMFINSTIHANVSDYGAFDNNYGGVVLGLSTRVWDNVGTVCYDFRDPNRGGCSSGIASFWL